MSLVPPLPAPQPCPEASTVPSITIVPLSEQSNKRSPTICEPLLTTKRPGPVTPITTVKLVLGQPIVSNFLSIVPLGNKISLHICRSVTPCKHCVCEEPGSICPPTVRVPLLSNVNMSTVMSAPFESLPTFISVNVLNSRRTADEVPLFNLLLSASRARAFEDKQVAASRPISPLMSMTP